MPSPAELLAADPQVLRDSGFSARKGQTLRALAERFVDGRLSDEALSRMADDEVEAALTEVSGSGRGRRAGSCSWLSTDRMSFSRATSRSDVRSNERTASTTFRPKTRWLRCQIAGGRIGALR